jgi:hypothetical protein
MRHKVFRYRLAQSTLHVIYDCSSHKTIVNRPYSLALPFSFNNQTYRRTLALRMRDLCRMQVHITCMKLQTLRSPSSCVMILSNLLIDRTTLQSHYNENLFGHWTRNNHYNIITGILYNFYSQQAVSALVFINPFSKVERF